MRSDDSNDGGGAARSPRSCDNSACCCGVNEPSPSPEDTDAATAAGAALGRTADGVVERSGEAVLRAGLTAAATAADCDRERRDGDGDAAALDDGARDGVAVPRVGDTDRARADDGCDETTAATAARTCVDSAAAAPRSALLIRMRSSRSSCAETQRTTHETA